MNPQLFHDLAASEEASGYPDNARALRAVPGIVEAFNAAINRMEAVADGIPVHKRARGVSQATHVAHMASHLAQHAKIARAALAAMDATTTESKCMIYAIKTAKGYLALQGNLIWFQDDATGWAAFTDEETARDVAEANHSAIGTKPEEEFTLEIIER